MPCVKCHRNTLTRFQIKANLVVPLLQGEYLWGLLCIHQCSCPRHWQEFEIDLVKQIANQLAIAIQQASLYQQLQIELEEIQKALRKLLGLFLNIGLKPNNYLFHKSYQVIDLFLTTKQNFL